MEEHIHCFHTSGYGTSTSVLGPNTGGNQGYCCHCGAAMVQTWYEEYVQIEGHGKFLKRLVRYYNEPKVQ